MLVLDKKEGYSSKKRDIQAKRGIFKQKEGYSSKKRDI